MRCAQDLEDTVQPVLTHDIANADEVDVVGGDSHGQIALGHLEHEVEAIFALDGARFYGLDERGAVMGIDNRLADLERHTLATPFVTFRVTRAIQPKPRRRSRLCRSGA